MNNISIIRRSLLVVVVLVGCTAPREKTWEDGVVLPNQCNLFSFSPRLDRVTYICDDDFWLAPLPNLEDATQIAPSFDDSSIQWSVYDWKPDGAAFLIKSYDRTKDIEGWWLFTVENPNDMLHLCALPSRERVVEWSPASNAFVVIAQGGGTVLVHADGSGCEELPFSGLIMRTPAVSWSPDGQSIAYADFSEDTTEVRVLDLSARQIISVYNGAYLTEWFPNGKEIALFGAKEVIPVVRADGSGLVKEVEIPEGYVVNTSRGNKWSPDGSKLALYLKIASPDYKPIAVGILDLSTLTISAHEIDSNVDEILAWTPEGDALVGLATGDNGRLFLKEIPVAP